MAAIGEQFIDFLGPGDDICGLSVSPREKDDLIQIWNKDKQVEPDSRVLEKVHKLVPDVRFNAEFYKRKPLKKILRSFLKKSSLFWQLMKLIQLSVRRIEATLESIQDSIIHSDKIPTSKHNGVAFIQRKKRTQTKKIDETIAKKQGLKHN